MMNVDFLSKKERKNGDRFNKKKGKKKELAKKKEWSRI